MSLKTSVLALILSFVTCLSLLGENSLAREVMDINLDILLEKTGDEAKQEAFDKATEQATHQLAEELLGADRLNHYWPGLRAKLLKNSTRFVLFIKGTMAPEVAGTPPHMTVSLKLSPDNLETILREEGLFNTGVRILPLVEVIDGRSKYIWWAYGMDEEKPNLAQDLFKKFLAQLAAKFKTKSVYVLDPTGTSFRMSVPATYRTEALGREDQMLFAQYLKADAVLSGKIEISRVGTGASKMTYDLQFYQSKSGRQIGEIDRAEVLNSDASKVILNGLEQTDRQVTEELLKKLNEVLSSGGLNLNMLKLAFSGTLNYRQQAELKRQLAQMREVRVVRERLFAPGRLVYEAETAVSAQDLAKSIQHTRFPQMNIAVDQVQDDGLVLSVRSLAPSSVQ